MKLIKNSVMFTFILITLIFSVSIFAFGQEHSHSFEVLYTVKPTCTQKGYTVMCCVCGESYKDNITDAYGHIFSEETVCYKAPTCIEKGEGGRYCKTCYAKTDIVYYDMTSHKPSHVDVKATLKKNGEKRKECSVCKKLYTKSIVSRIATVKLDKTVYSYDGKVKKPTVTVKDSKGNTLIKDKNFTVKYDNGRKKTGIYSVRVVFMGDYEGEKNLSFRIRPTAVGNLTAAPSISSVYLSWNKSKGADGYEIYLTSGKLVKDTDKLYFTVKSINGKKLKSGTDYTFKVRGYKRVGDSKVYSVEKTVKISTKPEKAQIKKLSSSSGKAVLTIRKQSCHGYEVKISTNKSFSNPKTVTLKGKNRNTYTLNNLVRGKAYYIRVRAYVVSGGKKYYGYYSNIKSFRR